MKKRLLSVAVIVLIIITLFSACGSSEKKTIDSDTALEYLWALRDYVEKTGDTDIYLYMLEDMDSDYIWEYITDTEISCDEYSEVIEYYECLCDMYGYQTYESIYYPELWKYYIPKETKIYHNDWLCLEFDNESEFFSTTDPTFFVQQLGYTSCPKCFNTTVYFLDVSEGTIHSEKKHLKLSTDDYITPYISYKLVGKETAIANGYLCCDTCNF